MARSKEASRGVRLEGLKFEAVGWEMPSPLGEVVDHPASAVGVSAVTSQLVPVMWSETVGLRTRPA